MVQSHPLKEEWNSETGENGSLNVTKFEWTVKNGHDQVSKAVVGNNTYLFGFLEAGTQLFFHRLPIH